MTEVTHIKHREFIIIIGLCQVKSNVFTNHNKTFHHERALVDSGEEKSPYNRQEPGSRPGLVVSDHLPERPIGLWSILASLRLQRQGSHQTDSMQLFVATPALIMSLCATSPNSRETHIDTSR